MTYLTKQVLLLLEPCHACHIVSVNLIFGNLWELGPSPSSLLLFNKFRNGEVCEWCFSPSKEIFFSSDIRIYIADFKITRICLVNSLYFSFTRDKKLFAYNLSADHQGVFSSEPFPLVHLSTPPHLHRPPPALVHWGRDCSTVPEHSRRHNPQPYNNFQVKAFLHGLPLCSYPTITYHGLPHCIAPQCITDLYTE